MIPQSVSLSPESAERDTVKPVKDDIDDAEIMSRFQPEDAKNWDWGTDEDEFKTSNPIFYQMPETKSLSWGDPRIQPITLVSPSAPEPLSQIVWPSSIPECMRSVVMVLEGVDDMTLQESKATSSPLEGARSQQGSTVTQTTEVGTQRLASERPHHVPFERTEIPARLEDSLSLHMVRTWRTRTGIGNWGFASSLYDLKSFSESTKENPPISLVPIFVTKSSVLIVRAYVRCFSVGSFDTAVAEFAVTRNLCCWPSVSSWKLSGDSRIHGTMRLAPEVLQLQSPSQIGLDEDAKDNLSAILDIRVQPVLLGLSGAPSLPAPSATAVRSIGAEWHVTTELTYLWNPSS